MRPLSTFLYCCLGGMSLFSYGDIRINPTRLHLNDGNRMARLTVKHLGNHVEKYSISILFYRMKSDGSLELAPNPTKEEKSGVEFFKFSPRDVTLAPNVEQVVRVMVVPPKNLSPGDYRAHLQIEPLALTREVLSGEVLSGEVDPNKGPELPMKISVAVPIVYQNGESQCTLSLSQPRLIRQTDKSWAVESELSYTGNRFPYGNLHTYFIPAKKEKPIAIGLTTGISSYVQTRKMIFPLEVPNGLNLSEGILKIEFRKSEAEGSALLASSERALKLGEGLSQR